MNLHHLTATTPAGASARLSTEGIPSLPPQGRCTARVRYAQGTTPDGERVYGHFAMTANALADALGHQLATAEGDAAQSSDLTLFHWLRDHDRTDEADEPVATLPPTWRGLEPTVEELFYTNEARAFCTGCNRNLARRDVRIERSPGRAGNAHYRYLCSEEHLLLELPVAHLQPVPESRAA